MKNSGLLVWITAPLFVWLLVTIDCKAEVVTINCKGEEVQRAKSIIPGWKFVDLATDKKEWLASVTAPNGASYRVIRYQLSTVGENRLLVQIENDRYGFSDLDGKLVIAPTYSEAASFFNGLALVRREHDGPLEIIDKDGKLVDTLPENVQLRSRQFWLYQQGLKGDGLLEVLLGSAKSNQPTLRLYSVKQKTVLSLEYSQLSEFWDGIARIKITTDEGAVGFGFINSQGELIIKPLFDHAEHFANGVAPVYSKREGRWFYIDQTGKEKISLPANCSQATAFSEGMAAIALHTNESPIGFVCQRGDLWAFIDTSGRAVIPPSFYTGDGVKPQFMNGLCAVSPGHSPLHYYGYIDLSGNWVIEPKFKAAYNFVDKVAGVELGATEFSPAEWLNAGTSKRDRVQLFEQFLVEHKIIGLSKEMLFSSLGSPDYSDGGYLRYGLITYAHGRLSAEIECNNERVLRYRYSSMPTDQWFDSDHPDNGDWPTFKRMRLH